MRLVESMKYNIYNHFVIEIIRKNGFWKAFRLGEGIKIPENNLIIPPELDEADLITFLDDMFHEFSRPGKLIERLD
jgi:hypothetical protein